MEALRLTATVAEGKLTVPVPDSFNNQEVEVIVRLKEEAVDPVKLTEEIKQRRMDDFGKAPLPHFPISKYDAYNQ